jgi:predicted HAD superfamily Cof-like phosphohydrolase
MTNEQANVKQWMKAFGQDTPDKPCIPSLEVRKLRAKLILEEALETITALGIGVYVQNQDNEWDCIQDFEDLEFNNLWEEETPEGNGQVLGQLQEIADGCEDLKVVTEGTLVACGLVQNNNRNYSVETPDINKDLLFEEVMRSNNSKMWTLEEAKKFCSEFPDNQNTFTQRHNSNMYSCEDKDGKIIKSPSYSPANLQPIIEEMSR